MRRTWWLGLFWMLLFCAVLAVAWSLIFGGSVLRPFLLACAGWLGNLAIQRYLRRDNDRAGRIEGAIKEGRRDPTPFI